MDLTYTQTFACPWGTVQDAGKLYTGAASIAVDETVNANGGDPVTPDVGFTGSGLKVLCFLSTVNSNVTSTPEDIDVTLTANRFSLVTSATETITELIVLANTAVGGAAGTIKIRGIYDPTP